MPVAKKSKKKEEPDKFALDVAAALYLELETVRCTARQCLNRMLESVRQLTKNPKLTMQKMKLAIRHWLTKGWVMISGEEIQVLRAGRAPIKQLADDATKAPQPA